MALTRTEHELRERLVRFLVLLLAIAAVGTLGYMGLEGWGFVDAFYMTVITLSTVGFAEVHPLSEAGRLFTIGLIVAGVSNAAYLLTAAGEYLISGAFRGSLRRQRMQRTIDRLEDHYIVCGYGRVGRQVVADLEQRGKPVVIVELDEAAAQLAGDRAVVVGDASDNEILGRAGIGRARGLVATTGDDAHNVFITLTARALNARLTIVARSNSPATDRKLIDAGATHVISPFTIAGRRISAQLLYPSITDFLDIVVQAGGIELAMEEVRVSAGSTLDGETVGESQIRSLTGANVLAVRTRDRQLTTNPPPGFRLSADDMLVALGTPEQLAKLTTLAGGRTAEAHA
jgi:voltage-gated potassium channel